MDLLLDTHALMWLIYGHERGRPLRSLLERADTTVSISSMSYAEIAIKRSIGKLEAHPSEVRALVQSSDALELPFAGGHAEALASLPLHHRDPFDRMLIAQAQAEQLTIATADAAFAAYDVPVFAL